MNSGFVRLHSKGVDLRDKVQPGSVALAAGDTAPPVGDIGRKKTADHLVMG
jgi:hypothetical protein